MQEILEKLYQGDHISREQSKKLFIEIIKNKISQEQLSAILISMKIRGETPEEIAGAADAFIVSANKFPRPNYLFADIVGTGGDKINSINISTASAIVTSCCGLPVAKHGNRSISSNSGSADLLSYFGISLDTPSNKSRKALDELGICFLFAPKYHVGFSNANSVRKILKTRTIFNIIGTIINPARPPITLVGVYSPELVFPIAETLKFLGYSRAAVVHGGGMDEVALHAPTQVSELINGEIKNYILTAKDFGLYPISVTDIKDFLPTQKHEIIEKLLKGEGDYIHEAIVAINVALLLRLFGYENLHDNTVMALNKIRSGAPYARVMELAEIG